MTELEKLKKMTGESDEDLLFLFLEEATEDVLIYTNRKHVIPEFEPYIRRLAVIAYNRQGTEGETARSEGGESYSFDNENKAIFDKLNRYRLVRAGGRRFEKRAHKKKQTEDIPPQDQEGAEG